MAHVAIHDPLDGLGAYDGQDIVRDGWSWLRIGW